ncbi:MAG: phosphotransferase family protein [Spirochaetes bacterium]|nr:phosphotransferase family protein [Spirochaetota bacterium]
MAYIDEPVEIRSGEELDGEKVREYLISHISGLEGEIQIKQFPSGFSNLTYCVKIGSREMILRRPPFGKKAKTAHDMLREFRILTNLRPFFRYCPEPLIYCDDESVMGAPFYVMERIKGIILRKNYPKGFVLSPKEAETLCHRFIEVLVELHRIDYSKAGLADFGKPHGYVRRQVEGWCARYRDARTPDAPDFEKVMMWLEEKMPPESSIVSVIHNDYKFDNVVLNPTNPLEIIGVLDWEMATIGDPLMDLGSSLAYWIDRNDPEDFQHMRMLPTTEPGMLTRNEIVRYYASCMGIEVEKFDFYLCFGLFRLAVIAQQIYYRFYHGQTKDKRFAMLIFAVALLEKASHELIARSDL